MSALGSSIKKLPNNVSSPPLSAFHREAEARGEEETSISWAGQDVVVFAGPAVEEPTRAGSQSDWPVDYVHQSEADCEESSGAESRAETLEAAAGEDAENAADAETSKKTECKADCWVVVNVSREVDESK
ncbi:hypothetical protein TESG_08317 [Trichophyton tonsurans CBS 112818]|uniref:Uncharacterized protein n=1 Tax=Trichophyton tonsurans (strain CBS 112818) TaxID=647933 RepID=F2RS83_TRIT1|nr:hypothetical protein TESG_08317 [Trichophyton tonsurans CBS 112818]